MQSFREQILSRLSVPESGSLVLAFSGGSDSLALLSLLPNDRTRAVYVNHRIRDDEEIGREIALNRSNCAMFGIPLKVVSLDRNEVLDRAKSGKIGLEAAARALRYERLFAEDADHILTAHHQDDEVETFLMRVLDGSPFYKYEGIRMEDGRLCRPLLLCPKRIIEGYLAEAGLKWSSDSTNSDDSYRRNFIRHNLLPLVSQEEKNIISRIGLNLAELRKKEESIPVFAGVRYVSFPLSSFLSSSPVARERAIYLANSYLPSHSRLKREEVLLVESFIESGPRRGSFSFHVVKAGDEVRFFPRRSDFVYSLENCPENPFFHLSIDAGSIDPGLLRLPLDELEKPAIVRSALAGDVIRLKDGVKSVRELEKENNVPYSIVLEDRIGIRCFFSRLYGGRDRLSKDLLGRGGNTLSVE